MRESDKKTWELITVDFTECKIDTSDIMCYINYIEKSDNVRIDFLRASDSSLLKSFVGKSDNVRKACMQYLEDLTSDNNGINFMSLEHAAYIGSELTKAEILKTAYIQD